MSASFVLDASVAAKLWLKDEPGWEVAKALVTQAREDRLRLYAPAIFPHEVCNLLSRAARGPVGGPRTPRLAAAAAKAAAEELLSLPIRIEPFDLAAVRDAMALSLSFGKPFDDMSYLALAEALDIPWITADERILLANPPAFPSHRIFTLAAFSRG